MRNAFHSRTQHPNLKDFGQWSNRDYLKYFLSSRAMKGRFHDEPSPAALLDAEEFARFCSPIRERIEHLFGSEHPRVSIVIPAFNEEPELLATLVSYTCLDLEPGVAELIIADNNSSDNTAKIIKNCGAKYVHCPSPGVGFCRQAAYRTVAETSQYIWLTDADTRMIPPITGENDVQMKSTILRTNVQYLDQHPDVIGISTGGVVEGAHPVYEAVHRLLVLLGKSRKYSCWAGYNQFVRRWALDQIGGIDVEVEFGDDQHRQYQLARLGKRLNKQMESANSNPALADPVYYSGRRYGTLPLLVRHYREALGRRKLPKDEYGFPLHQKGEKWRLIRK